VGTLSNPLVSDLWPGFLPFAGSLLRARPFPFMVGEGFLDFLSQALETPWFRTPPVRA